jgi:hypothetical protein
VPAKIIGSIVSTGECSENIPALDPTVKMIVLEHYSMPVIYIVISKIKIITGKSTKDTRNKKNTKKQRYGMKIKVIIILKGIYYI